MKKQARFVQPLSRLFIRLRTSCRNEPFFGTGYLCCGMSPFSNIATTFLSAFMVSESRSNLPGSGGRDSHIKRGGMLVVSLRGGVNSGFWPRLVSIRLVLIMKLYFGDAREKIFKKYLSIYLSVYFRFLLFSLLGVKKAWATPRLVSFSDLI